MKNFFKENFALVTGIVLPLALVLMFMFAGEVNKIDIEPPQYSGIFATRYNQNVNNAPFSISTDNGKLVIRKNDIEEKKYKPQPPELYAFDYKTMRARKIDIDFTNVKDGIVVDPDIDELNKHKIIAGNIAPDGYEFEYIYRSSHGIFGDIFGFDRSRRNYYTLTKDGSKTPIHTPQRLYSAKFIGWMSNDE